MRILLIILFIPIIGFSQMNTLSEKLFDSYDNYKESSLQKRRFKHQDIQPLIDQLKLKEDIKVNILGKSIEGRSISMISMGTGKTNVLLWSQMHGDESTATMAIFDILNYLQKNKKLLQNISIHFIPMLNPDGAEKFKRRNAIGIDINRDAVRLQSPESKILKIARDSLHADFGFNLHDQSKYYNAERTEKPATISYLAPAYNFEKSVNNTRANAMKLIVQMNDVIQHYAPGQVGRYSDDFEPRAFGDNIQKWGTSTILIESGGYKNDPEKQFIRKLNFVSILTAIQSISTKGYKEISVKKYQAIPRNDRKLFDLKITELTFPYLGNNYTVDLGINKFEIGINSEGEFNYVGKLVDIGDLSTYYGYESINAKELSFQQAETYPKILSDLSDLEKLDYKDLLSQGYTKIVFDSIPEELDTSNIPLQIISVNDIRISKDNNIPKPILQLKRDPSFLLMKNEKLMYAIIQGNIYDFRNKGK